MHERPPPLPSGAYSFHCLGSYCGNIKRCGAVGYLVVVVVVVGVVVVVCWLLMMYLLFVVVVGCC